MSPTTSRPWPWRSTRDIADALATVANKVDRAGDTMTGMLSLPGANPSSLNHATRKGYVDEQMETRVAVSGDSMSGDLDMGTHRVTNLDAPTGANDAVRKSYVDTASSTRCVST